MDVCCARSSDPDLAASSVRARASAPLSTAAGAGLFKGNSLTVIKTLPQSAIQFFTYDTAKDLLLAARVKRRGRGCRDASCEELSQVLPPLPDFDSSSEPQVGGLRSEPGRLLQARIQSELEPGAVDVGALKRHLVLGQRLQLTACKAAAAGGPVIMKRCQVAGRRGSSTPTQVWSARSGSSSTAPVVSGGQELAAPGGGADRRSRLQQAPAPPCSR